MLAYLCLHGAHGFASRIMQHLSAAEAFGAYSENYTSTALEDGSVFCTPAKAIIFDKKSPAKWQTVVFANNCQIWRQHGSCRWIYRMYLQSPAPFLPNILTIVVPMTVNTLHEATSPSGSLLTKVIAIV